MAKLTLKICTSSETGQIHYSGCFRTLRGLFPRRRTLLCLSLKNIKPLSRDCEEQFFPLQTSKCHLSTHFHTRYITSVVVIEIKVFLKKLTLFSTKSSALTRKANPEKNSRAMSNVKFISVFNRLSAKHFSFK